MYFCYNGNMSAIEEWFTRERQQGCQRKQGFVSQQAAQDAAYLARMQFGHEYDTYQCPWCQQWHLSTQ